MGFFEGLTGKSSKTEVKESVKSKIEKEKKAYRENLNGLNSDVKKKGGWTRVGEFFKKGIDFYAENVAPIVGSAFFGLGIGTAIVGGPAALAALYFSGATLAFLTHTWWYEDQRNEYMMQNLA